MDIESTSSLNLGRDASRLRSRSAVPRVPGWRRWRGWAMPQALCRDDFRGVTNLERWSKNKFSSSY